MTNGVCGIKGSALPVLSFGDSVFPCMMGFAALVGAVVVTGNGTGVNRAIASSTCCRNNSNASLPFCISFKELSKAAMVCDKSLIGVLWWDEREEYDDDDHADWGEVIFSILSLFGFFLVVEGVVAVMVVTIDSSGTTDGLWFRCDDTGESFEGIAVDNLTTVSLS